MIDARRHTFSHFKLSIRIARVQLDSMPACVADDRDRRWLSRGDLAALGMPAPVKAILDAFQAGRPQQNGDVS
jgi:A/G-specific adenine glycosylase